MTFVSNRSRNSVLFKPMFLTSLGNFFIAWRGLVDRQKSANKAQVAPQLNVDGAL